MANKINFTKTALDNLPLPEPGQRAAYHDSQVNGLQVRITAAGVKTFCVFRRVAGGTPERVTLGRYPDLTPEQARKKAKTIIGDIAQGVSPATEKRRKKLSSRTLGEVVEEYVEVRGDLKASTVRALRETIQDVCGDWLAVPLVKLTPDMVEVRHREYGRRSKAQANGAMRYLRALFNFAMARYLDADGNPLIAANPVQRLTRLKLWHRVERRRTAIKPHELAAWWQAVEELGNDTLRDAFQLLLLTGLRRNEGLLLKWNCVDLEGRTLTIVDPKNRRDHTLPLSDFLHDMLTRRKAEALSDYVFASDNGKPVQDIRWRRNAVTQASGITWTPHDLRRTFATVAESLDIPAYALKRLLNHADGADVTAGYIVTSVERLRAPMQKITDYILKTAGIKPAAEVVNFKQQRG